MYSLDLLPKECHIVQPSTIPTYYVQETIWLRHWGRRRLDELTSIPRCTFIIFEREKKNTRC